FDLATFEHARELLFEHLARLARQYVENVLAKHGTAGNAEFAEFAIAVPGRDAILAIDGIQRQRQAVDDRFDEPFLRFAFGSAALDFARETHRRFARGLIERTDVSGERGLLRGGVDQTTFSFTALFA